MVTALQQYAHAHPWCLVIAASAACMVIGLCWVLRILDHEKHKRSRHIHIGLEAGEGRGLAKAATYLTDAGCPQLADEIRKLIPGRPAGL